jgi:hypothetical protein
MENIFLHPFHVGQTMSLGKKKPRTIEKKFGVGVTYTQKVYKPFPRPTNNHLINSQERRK